MISVVIPSIDPVKLAAITRRFEQLLSPGPFEIVPIPDARGLAEAYNRAFARSRGDALIFCHDDIEILTPDLRQRLLDHLEHADVLGIAGTTKLRDARWASAGPPYLFGQIAQINAAEKCFD